MDERIVFLKTTSADSDVLLYGLATIAILVITIAIIVYRYRRYKKFQELSQEMSLLEFDSEQETTVTDLVKRYSLHEPVKVLFSLQLFDDLATREISRILGSAGSVNQKQQFINRVYEIRKKTYFQDLKNVQLSPKAAETVTQ